MKEGALLLTSTGLTSKNIADCFMALVSDRKLPVAIITTAAEGKENNKYSQLARKQFSDMGFEQVDFVDLETEPEKDLSAYSILYVCGGNTFYLLKYAREAHFKESVEALLARGGVYIGVSAGSIIVGPSIDIAAEVEPDPNDIGLGDLTGLQVVDTIILPHYSQNAENDTLNFEARHHIVVQRLTDSQALLIRGDKKTVVE